MPTDRKDLGRLISVFAVQPSYLQRAVVIAVLSFLFFLGTMLVFYLRGVFMYFLLATGFLVLYLVMMFSIWSMRRAVVRLYENGIEYKKNILRWDDITSVRTDNCVVLTTASAKTISFPNSLAKPTALMRQIEFRIKNA